MSPSKKFPVDSKTFELTRGISLELAGSPRLLLLET